MALSREREATHVGLVVGKNQGKISQPLHLSFYVLPVLPTSQTQVGITRQRTPLMPFLQFPRCRVRSADSGLRVGVNQRYPAHLSCASSVICVKNTKTCGSFVSSRSLQSGRRESYYHVAYVMREVRSHYHGHPGKPTRWNRGEGLALMDGKIW